MKMKTSRVVILMIIAILLALYILFPFFLVLINSFKNQAAIVQDPISLAGATFSQFVSNVNAVVNNKNFVFWHAFGSSALVTIVSLFLLAVFGGMAAWVICRNKTKWSTAIYMIFISSMIIPFQVVMLPLIATFREVGKFVGLGMNGTLPGLIFAYCGFGGAMTVFILTGFIKGIPYELEEAAAIDGCSPEGTFFRVIFPLLKPVIVTVSILNGMWIWNDFLLPLLMVNSSTGSRTLVLAAYNFVGALTTKWHYALAAMVLAIFPSVICFVFLQRYIVDGVVAGAVKG